MITTLIKHELLRTRKPILGIWLAATLLVALGNLLFITHWPVLAQLGTAGAFICVFILLPAIQLFLGVDYWISSYRRTGYFTQTLPIKGTTIFVAKLLWGTIVSLLTLIVVVALGLLTLPSMFQAAGASDLTVGQFLGTIWEWIGANISWWGMILILIVGFIMLMAYLIQFYFAASIGSEEPMNRWGIWGPVLVMVILYGVQQALMLISILAIPLGLDDDPLGLVGINFLQAMISNTALTTIPIGFLPVLVIVPFVLLWRTRYSWKRKIALV